MDIQIFGRSKIIGIQNNLKPYSNVVRFANLVFQIHEKHERRQTGSI